MRAANTELRAVNTKLRTSIKYTIERIDREVMFALCKVPHSFSGTTAFSKLDLRLFLVTPSL